MQSTIDNMNDFSVRKKNMFLLTRNGIYNSKRAIEGVEHLSYILNSGFNALELFVSETIFERGEAEEGRSRIHSQQGDTDGNRCRVNSLNPLWEESEGPHSDFR